MAARKKQASSAKAPSSSRKSARPKAKASARKSAPPRAKTPSWPDADVDGVLGWLKDHATRHTLEGMARYGIPRGNAFGVSVADIRVLGKQLGQNHELALALWDTGQFEARMLASFVDDPAQVTAAQMDRWCRDFDSWAICDNSCFHLFDRTAHAWAKVERWCDRRAEFEKRAAFALLASLALHDKRAPDEAFIDSLPLIERAATDDRNFVKKGVSWALRLIGRRNRALNTAALDTARRLARSSEASARWIGTTAVRELTGAVVARRLAARKK